MRNSDFKKLQIWLLSRNLCIDLYKITMKFPAHEKVGMISQIRRAALSVPTNIAEGHGRSSNADFARFLYISIGSIRELETLLDISAALGYMDDCSEEIARLQQIAKMTTSLINKLKSES